MFHRIASLGSSQSLLTVCSHPKPSPSLVPFQANKESDMNMAIDYGKKHRAKNKSGTFNLPSMTIFFTLWFHLTISGYT